MTTPNSELEKEIVEIIKRARFNSFHGLLENGQELAEEITALIHTETQRAVEQAIRNFFMQYKTERINHTLSTKSDEWKRELEHLEEFHNKFLATINQVKDKK